MLNEFLQNLVLPLKSHPGPLFFFDGTFGGGGHSFSLLEHLPQAYLVAFDQDPDVAVHARTLIKEKGLDERVLFFPKNYSQFLSEWELIRNRFPQFSGFDGALLDLGISSHQLNVSERGLSFRQRAPLDMRMNYQSCELATANEVLHEKTEQELADIFYKYGEEKFSRKIAKKIVEMRDQVDVFHTDDLENIIFHAYPPQMRHGRTHPATRCFQALRIYVNGELDVLEQSLIPLAESLNSKGRLMVISFHSLEDRIVKHQFKSLIGAGTQKYQLITKKPLLPSAEEMTQNNRSRSAKTRIIEKSQL